MTNFAYPQLFWLLILPFIFYAMVSPVRGLHGDALKIPFIKDLEQIKTQAQKFNLISSGRSLLLSVKIFYLFILWGLLVAAAARPQFVGEPYRKKTENRDIMLVIDISTSMLQPDFSYKGRSLDRLTGVKNVVSQFIENRTDDRMGLILFGTRAYLQSPLTFDKQSLKNILFNADAGMAGNSTAIGDALGLALKTLSEDKEKGNNLIILLTDGENNDGYFSMAQAIDLAEKENIKVYTIGVGSDASFMGSLFGLRTDELDERSLKDLAARTRGNYFKATDLLSLAEIYAKIDALEPQNTEGTVIQERKDLFYIPLTIALILALFLLFLPRRYLK